MQRTCQGITKAGKPCRSFAITDSEFCQMHDPNQAARAAEIRKSGGMAKLNDRRTAKQWAAMSRNIQLEDLPAMLVGAGLATLNGELEPQRMTAFASALKAAASIAEVAILERRVAELEEIMKPDKG